MAIKSIINQKPYDIKSISRFSQTEWEKPFEVGDQTQAEFIKVSLELQSMNSQSGATDSALDSKAYFMTSVGSNPIISKTFFFCPF